MGFDEFLDSWNSLPRLDDIQAATGYRMTFKEVSATGATELNDDSWAAFKDNCIAQGLDECLQAI